MIRALWTEPHQDVPFRRYVDLLRDYLAPQWRGVLLLAVLLPLSIGLQLANPLIVRFFIDSALAGAGLAPLTAAALLYVGIALAQQSVAVADVYLGEHLGWTGTNALRADLTRHCLRLGPAFHQMHPPGELIERIDGDVTALANFFSRFLVVITGNALLLLGMLGVLFGIDWRIGLTFTAFSGVAIALLAGLRRLGGQVWAKRNQAIADFFGVVEEQLGALEDIQGNGAGTHVLRRQDDLAREGYRSAIIPNLLSGSTWSATVVLFSLATAIAFLLGTHLFAAGVLTIGTVYLIYSYAELLRRPIEQLTQQFQDLHQAGGSIVRIRQLLDTPDDVSDGSQRPPVGAPAVAFEGVTFVYPTGGAATTSSSDTSTSPALLQLSFRLEAGQVLGVVGRTGSGKTTLARLLFRLYDPSEGTIRLGGVDIRTIRRAELRRVLGLITQEVQLFEASVRDNLTFFNPSVPDEHLRALLHDLELGGWFESLPQGLDTILHGGGLSAGEAQLLAFARIFLKDPALVILDEASSRLDPATERRLERALDTLLRRRTGIIIAHRLRTVQRADQILVLDNGRAVEYGPRAALAADPASRFSQLLHASGGKGVLHEA